MRGIVFFISCLSLMIGETIIAQDEKMDLGKIEVYLIDAYVTPELPHKFVLSFFTSDSCLSKVKIDEKYEFIVSKNFTDNHKAAIYLTNVDFDSTSTYFRVHLTGKNNNESYSDLYELVLPYRGGDVLDQNGPGIFQVCCFGGIIFGLPTPTYVSAEGKNYFSLTKEIPVLSFYSVGYNYPIGYLGLGYAYVFNTDRKHYFRIGYKHIFQIPYLEYISPGLNYFTDLKGYNGLGPEISLGLVRIYNVFTLFARYRYNFQPVRGGTNFHEIAIGLYSNFFSLNL